jgi:heme-degrading monooxygenase HmoA
MVVVIFRARVREVDDAYLAAAAHMREMALQQFGCLAFQALTQGDDEIAVSYWPDEDHVLRWKAQAEHVLAQQQGRQQWYLSYEVQVAQVSRNYRWEAPASA